jgi:hypothetical protein
MTLTQGHPYLRNNDVYLCFIIFCIYTVRYKEVNQNIPDSPNTGIFCKSVFCQSLTIDQIKCIIQTPNVSDNNWVSDYDGEWNMYIYVLNVQNV